ncbi:MAG: fibronectin type III domain-containing protein [Bacilli bacterium]
MKKIDINFKKIRLNKTILLIVVAIITLIVFIGGTTYAYFANDMADPTQKNMEIMSNTVDNLFFEIEKDIQINANINNFTQGQENLSDNTDATATLIPNNYNNQAIAMYNVYIIIEENDLEYTTENQTPELLLNVTDPNGKNLENITGLIHYDNGFDITTRTGGFLIASDYVIEASNVAKVQTWNIEITLVNLDSNQNANLGKRFSAKIYLTQEKMSSYIPIQITNMNASPTYNTIDTTVNISNGTAKAAKYYFGIEEVNTTIGYLNQKKAIRLNNSIIASATTVEYYESNEPNYEFKNLKANTRYIIYSYVVDENGITSNIYQTEVITNDYTYATISNIETSSTLNSITITVNAIAGDGTIEKYKYSKDNGQTWIESTSNTYTFSDLNDTTEYKIKVKALDSNGYESAEYYKAVATITYVLPVVSNVEATSTYNSITLTPSGTNGTGTITKYLYSINGGSYQESNTFSGLNEQTEYTIKVKAVDENGRESNPVYELKVTTDTYEVPVINNVTTSSTTDSITINVNGSNGDGTITTYYYSRDNGSNWYESTHNTYTFSSLTSNTTFYIKVKVKDSNGRESAEYSTSEKTKYINPVVNSVTTSNITTSSITLNVNATAGSNNITTYYYSKDNGSSYVSSTSSSYTFSGLSAGTTYNFKVYVVDSGGVKSNEVTKNADTDYNYPKINSISSSTTQNSITVTANASPGANSLKTYYFSINNGSYISSTSNKYTFNGLSSGVSYTIKVYVVDTLGKSSNVFSKNISTDSYIKPTISRVNVSSTYDTITVDVYANSGTNEISGYYYSINNGSYVSSGISRYTFSGLNSGTTYSIRVYVRDTSGYDSSVYYTNASTSALSSFSVVNNGSTSTYYFESGMTWKDFISSSYNTGGFSYSVVNYYVYCSFNSSLKYNGGYVSIWDSIVSGGSYGPCGNA